MDELCNKFGTLLSFLHYEMLARSSQRYQIARMNSITLFYYFTSKTQLANRKLSDSTLHIQDLSPIESFFGLFMQINKIEIKVKQSNDFASLPIIQYFKMTTLKYITLGLFIYLTLNISNTLPDLIRRTYHGTASRIINVTIGEYFSIPLPHFDTTWNSDNFQVFQIPEDQFKKQSSHPTAGQNQQPAAQESTSQPPPIGIDYLPFECSLIDGGTFVSQELKSIREQYSNVKNTRWQQNQYVILHSKSLLYILKTASSELIAYIYNDHTIEKITTYKIDQFIQRQEQIGQLNISPPVIAASSNQETIYIFTSLGIWEVKTKTILSNVRYVGALSQFNSANYGGIDKVLHGESGVLIGLKRSTRKVFVIPQPSINSTQKYKFTQISSYNGKQIFAQDIYIVSNTLYILDFYKGVFIFSIVHQYNTLFRSLISFDTFGGNFQFKVYLSTIFINFNDVEGSKIAQVSFDIATQTYNLVRFIKSDDFINIFKVFSSVPTQYYLQPHQQKFDQDYMDSFLFLIQNYDDIEIYPFNVDPRMISRAYNAVKLKGSDIRQIFHIFSDKYLIISNQYVQYLRITITKPSITCKTKKPQVKAPQNYYLLTFASNISTCQHKDHSQVTKRLFNEICQMKMNYYIHIGDPEESQYQKILMYTLVIGVLLCFVAGLLCLMQWRNNKMVILGRLKNEIVNFRNRHKRIQPFVEQNFQQKELQIDVPQVSAVLERE